MLITFARWEVRGAPAGGMYSKVPTFKCHKVWNTPGGTELVTCELEAWEGGEESKERGKGGGRTLGLQTIHPT